MELDVSAFIMFILSFMLLTPYTDIKGRNTDMWPLTHFAACNNELLCDAFFTLKS